MRCGGCRAYPHLSRFSICEKFNVPQALPQFVKGSPASRKQCVSAHRRLDAAPAAIKQFRSDVAL
jgi:hypothetical protein